MTSAEIWNYIVEEHNNHYSDKEDNIQKLWEVYMSELFGYSRLLGEIDNHRNIQIGSMQRAIPDIIIKNKNQDLFDIELKQYNLPFNESMEMQLKSYLDLLHIQVGVIICQKIYVYFYSFGNVSKKAEIEIIENNTKGIDFIELFTKNNFSKEKVEEFIDEINKERNSIIEIRKEFNEKLLKDLAYHYFENKYSKESVEKVLEEYKITVEKKSPPPPPPPPPESIQDWVKRIFEYILGNDILSARELELLHDTWYSKNTFGIQYAMLVDKQSDTIIAGHSRYWQKPICGYYVCSQWWKDQDKNYENNIKKWLGKVLPNYEEYNLGRRFTTKS